LSGTLNVSITGNANYASSAGSATYAGYVSNSLSFGAGLTAASTYNGSSAVSVGVSFSGTGSGTSAAYSNHTHDYSGSYAALAHASRHASGGADAVTPASIGAAASSHTHDYVPNWWASGLGQFLYINGSGTVSSKNLAASDIPTLTSAKMTGTSTTVNTVTNVGTNPGTGNPGYYTVGMTFTNGVLTSVGSGSWHDQ
jgi:hypothetical protein